MFGHQDDQAAPQDNQDDAVTDENQAEPNSENNEPDQGQQAQSDEQTEQPADAPADAPSDDSKPGDSAMNGVDELVIKPGEDSPDNPAEENTPDEADKPEEAAGNGDDDWQQPDTPSEEDKERIRDVISPAGGFPKQPSFQYPSGASSSPGPQPDDGANEELAGVRKQALDDLSPLVDKLDLPPEDKFRALMMIIQSTDNQDLVKQAYEAAHSIEDEKVRAQALYDIISEINYFTNPPEAPADSE